MARAAAALLLAVGAAAALGACSDGSRAPAPTDSLPALSDAIGRLNATRGALTGDAAAVARAAQLIDNADELGAKGDRSGLRAIDGGVAAATARADEAAREVRTEVTKYAAAIDAVRTAANSTTTLEPAQTAALLDVASKGAAEVAESVRFAQAVARAWPTYRALRDAESTWLTRAQGGWYRDTKEAADAYTVLTGDVRPDVNRQRAALQRADRARVRQSNAAGRAIRTARESLKGLVS
jgi:hypothetical protein